MPGHPGPQHPRTEASLAIHHHDGAQRSKNDSVAAIRSPTVLPSPPTAGGRGSAGRKPLRSSVHSDAASDARSVECRAMAPSTPSALCKLQASQGGRASSQTAPSCRLSCRQCRPASWLNTVARSPTRRAVHDAPVIQATARVGAWATPCRAGARFATGRARMLKPASRRRDASRNSAPWPSTTAIGGAAARKGRAFIAKGAEPNN